MDPIVSEVSKMQAVGEAGYINENVELFSRKQLPVVATAADSPPFVGAETS